MKLFLIRFFGIFVLFSLISSFCFGESIPSNPVGYVNDFAGIIAPEQQQRLENIISELEKKTTAQIAVVTVLSTKPETIEQYAVRLFEKWKIGTKGKDNGILLLVSVGDREVRIEVGYGLESVLTDALSKLIIERYMIPYFRQGQYSQGIEAAVVVMVSMVAKFYGVEITGQEDYFYDSLNQQRNVSSLFNLLVFLILLALFIFNRRLFFYLVLFGGLDRRSDYWYGGRGGYGGGFGGFGGGMSGGGGASGKW